jgi:CHAD domain-containing protein
MTPPLDQSYRLLAAKYLRKQAKRLAEQIDDARRADDPECIHQTRVASRRLRAGMRMFAECFDPKQLKSWRKQIRRVTNRLGDARDRDVQIEFLCGVLDELDEKACYPGIARLLVKLEQQRERLQTQVVEAADRLAASGVLEEMRAVTKEVLSDANAQQTGLQSPFVFAQTRRHIVENLEQLLSYQDSLADPGDHRRHHAMRIAAKRLRYTVEISAPVYDGKLDGTIRTIKRVQTLLGEIHDCDVWVEHLQAFAAQQRKRIVKRYGHPGPFARLEVGIDYLQRQRLERRQQVFRELVDYWQQLSRQRQWEMLVETVRGPGPQPAAPQPPMEAAPDAAAKPETGESRSNDGGADKDSVGEPQPGIGRAERPKQQAEVAAPAASRETQAR